VATFKNYLSGLRNIFTWSQHRQHGYAGGDDYKTKIGQAIKSPATCRATLMHDGLNGVRVTVPDGNSVVLRELKSVKGKFPRNVKQGEVIGYAGRERDGEAKATHIEGWLNGVRVAFSKLQAHYSTSARTKRIAAFLNARAKALHLPPTAAARTGRRGPYYWRLVQTWGRHHNLYPKPKFVINGIPGPQTRKVEAKLATLAK
jgi:hypothetical protein